MYIGWAMRPGINAIAMYAQWTMGWHCHGLVRDIRDRKVLGTYDQNKMYWAPFLGFELSDWILTISQLLASNSISDPKSPFHIVRI
jgi:hypothetical protein